MTSTCSSVIAAPIADVFGWHERPGAATRLLPPWLPVRVVQEAASLRDGQAVLRLPGGMRWVAQHSGYDPPRRFVDELVSLPLPWRHIHDFSPETEASTRVTDTVETPTPDAVVRPGLAWRHRQLADDLAAQHRLSGLRASPLTVAITGSSGLIGTALAAFLTTAGHQVIRLVRRPPRGPGERLWRPADPDPAMLNGVDAVVHLAGASIFGRFTAGHRRAIRDSRVGPTARLARAVAETPLGPNVLVSASAIGYYGPDRGDEALEEESGRGGGLLADLVMEWEAATRPAGEAGVRVVNVRTGLVQSPQGGLLRLLRPLYLAGLGGPVGGGEQWWSWIDIDDVTDIYARAILDEALTGPVNTVAPEPVRGREYAAILARVLRRPALVAVPALGPELVLGRQGAQELALASQRVRPARLIGAGHAFRRPSLEACLRHQLGHVQQAA